MKPKGTSELAWVELQRVEMIKSYTDAIIKAGGSPEKFLHDINTMTVAEMIDCLGQNGVRFYCNKER